jgi:hypothetical protein
MINPNISEKMNFGLLVLLRLQSLQVISESTLLALCRGRRTCFWISCLIIPSYHSWNFDKKMNKEGAISMIIGLLLMLFYMLKFKFGLLMVERCCCWLKAGGSPEGFGTIAMIVNFVVAFTVKVLHRSLPRCSRYCGAH